jgi:hypothetical protein
VWAGGKPVKRDWVMNMDGRSYLSVFHEYVRRALQKQPVYEFVQLGEYNTRRGLSVFISLIVIIIIISPLLGHKHSLWITHKENGL